MPTKDGPIELLPGYVSWVGKVAEDDAAVVKLLIQNGAVLYVKTNVPQTLMVRTPSPSYYTQFDGQEFQWGETLNNVFGRTLNPHNTAFTCGGSSGGEGALIALRGSVLGVGTDIAGYGGTLLKLCE